MSAPQRKSIFIEPPICISKRKKLSPWRCINVDTPVVDSGFPVGGRQPRRGAGLKRRLHFKNIVCRNERI